MIQKFRNSLFGFNRDDVVNFVVTSKENENNLKKKVTELSLANEKLNDELSELSLNLKDINELNIQLQAQLGEYKNREETLTKLSESIGKLYLVAQANANSAISAARQNVEQSREVVDNNIIIAEEAESEFNQINNILNEKTQNFINEINELKLKLSQTKEKVLENLDVIDKKFSEFDEISDTIKVSVNK